MYESKYMEAMCNPPTASVNGSDPFADDYVSMGTVNGVAGAAAVYEEQGKTLWECLRVLQLPKNVPAGHYVKFPGGGP